MKWKTADGRELLISEMTDSHLVNSFRLVLKWQQVARTELPESKVMKREAFKRNLDITDMLENIQINDKPDIVKALMGFQFADLRKRRSAFQRKWRKALREQRDFLSCLFDLENPHWDEDLSDPHFFNGRPINRGGPFADHPREFEDHNKDFDFESPSQNPNF